MPNHITQKMTIVGPHEDVRRFVEIAANKPPRGLSRIEPSPEPVRKHLCFHAIVPLPPEFETVDYSDVGYQMERDAWGTKWGAYNEAVPIVGVGFATYEFNTAWHSPSVFFKKASARFSTLRFFVSWGGEGPTRGRAFYIDGVRYSRECDDYSYPQRTEAECNAMTLEEDSEWYEKVYEPWVAEYLVGHDAWVRGMLSLAPSGIEYANRLDALVESIESSPAESVGDVVEVIRMEAHDARVGRSAELMEAVRSAAAKGLN